MVHSQFLFLAIVISLLGQLSTNNMNKNNGMKKFLQNLTMFIEEPSPKNDSTSGDDETPSKEESRETPGETSLVNIKCLWVNKYNVYSLQKLQNTEKDYTNDVSKGKVIFNFCQNTNTKINNEDSQSTFLWEKNNSLIRISGSIDGDSETNNKWSEQEDEDGNFIKITFTQGEKCSNSSHHKTIVKIYCNEEKDFFKNIAFSGFDENSCTHTISSKSIYGCALTDIYLLKKILHQYWYIFGLGLIIIGAYLCFYGHKIVWLTAILILGLVFCFIISIIFLHLLPSLITTEASLWILLGVGFTFGAIIGCLIKTKTKILVAVIGAGMGYSVALFVYQIIQSFIEWNPQVLYYIVVIACIIGGIILGFFLYNSFLIIGTCIFGGYLAMRGVIAIFGEYMDEGEFVDLIKSGEIEQMKEIRNGWTYAYLGLWLVLMVGGLFCQCKMYKKS